MAAELIIISLIFRVNIEFGWRDLPEEGVSRILFEVFIVKGVLVLWFLSLRNRYEILIKNVSRYERSIEDNKIKN